ncbi:hypothetical protein tb265_44370 [Gemmatimonadetes bacterium T265]|nr:hypothetical protein tb265_44370 [Gemmatimonadetes bacterium T265]
MHDDPSSPGVPPDARPDGLRERLARLSPAQRALVERALAARARVAAATDVGSAAADEHTIPRRPDGPARLAFNQEVLWRLDRALPDLVAYNVPRVLRISGALDVDALRRALDLVVARHEALRTRFVDGADGPRQIVDAPAPVPFEVRDVRPEQVDDVVRACTRRRFDLARDPQLRATLLRLASDEHVLHLLSHHLVSDEGSRDVLFRELGAAYDAFRRGERPALPPVPVQYADWAAWQRDAVERGSRAAGLAYWRAQLTGLTTLELPVDRPRASAPNFDGARCRRLLAPDVRDGLAALARAHDATLFMVLLAAFDVLLARTTGQDDVAVATPATARGGEALDGAVGFFANTLVLRTDLAADPTFVELLGRVRRTCLDAYEHQAVPFERVALEVHAGGGARGRPLAEVGFGVDTPGEVRVILGDAHVEVLPTDHGAAKFDLALAFSDLGGEGLRATVEYRTALFDAATIDPVLDHLATLLAGIVADPARRVSRLPLLTAEERHTLLIKWNRTATGAPVGGTVPALVARSAAATPEAPAVVDGDRTLSFRELELRADRLAAELVRRGAGPGALVGVFMRRSPELVVALLAVLKTGAAYVPIDAAYPPARIAAMLDDARAVLLLTQPALADRVPDGAPITLALDARVWPAGERLPDTPVVPAPGPGGGDALAYVIFTSGSTGRPKGAMVTHRGLANYVAWAVDAYEVRRGRGAPLHSSIAFDLTVTSLWAPLAAGRAVHVVPDGDDVAALGRMLCDPGGFSFVKLTPAHLDLLRETVGPSEAPGATRVFVIGGEQLLGESLAFWQTHAPDTVHVNEYGPTETVVGCCVEFVGGDRRITGPVPIGRPIANTRLYVLDAHGEPVPAGVAGELYIGGDGVGAGYLHRADLTAAAFVPDRLSETPNATLYRTGDRVRYRRDGTLEFLGRIDAQIKLRGFRIEPGEIEAALVAVRGVTQACVVARDDAATGPRLVAYVVGADGPPPDGAALRTVLRQTLPEHMIPAAVVPLAALPLTPNGKVDRDRLPAPAADIAAARTLPRTPREAEIAAVWAEALGVPTVGVDERFVELGGHSLLAMRVVGRVRQLSGVLLPLDQLLRGATVADLAALADADGGAGGSAEDDAVPLTPVARGAYQPAAAPRAGVGV